MNLKLNGNGNGQPKPYLRIALLAVAVILVGLLLYRQVDRLSGPKRSVWVARSGLAQGAILSPEDFERKEVRESRIPEGAIDNLNAAVGRRLARVKTAGAPFVAEDLAAAVGGDAGSIAGLVPEGRVLMTLRVGSRALPLTELRRGDRLDVLAATGRDSASVASGAYFVGWIRPAQSGKREKASIFGIDLTPPGRPASGDENVSLLLALHPEEVSRLARAEAARLPLNIVLHGRTEVQEGRLLDLSAPRPSKVELIAGARRETVALQP